MLHGGAESYAQARRGQEAALGSNRQVHRMWPRPVNHQPMVWWALRARRRLATGVTGRFQPPSPLLETWGSPGRGMRKPPPTRRKLKGAPSPPQRRDVLRFNEWFKTTARALVNAHCTIDRVARERLPLAEQERIHSGVYTRLCEANPRKLSALALQERSQAIPYELSRLKVQHRAVVRSRLVGVLRTAQRALKRARDAGVRRSETWPLVRLLKRGAIQHLTDELLKSVTDEARSYGGRGLKSPKYLGVAPGIRRLATLGVPAPTIAILLNDIGITGFTVADVRNTIARR